MTRFASARDAKEFLVGRIVDEAQREGVSLSEVERNMLYFSESDWAPPDIVDTNRQFELECDQPEYERKIAALVRNASKRARKEDKQEFDAWSDAIDNLSKEDHYLLVMIEQAGQGVRPQGDRLRLWVIALAIVVGGLGLMWLAGRLGVPLTKESLGGLAWITAACATGAYLLFRGVAGRDRADELLNRLLALFFGRAK
jgi:hypothetical protein